LKTRAAGFTLIEVLVAIALVAASVTLSYRALAAVISGSEQLGARIEVGRDLDRLFERMERDCLHHLPNPVRGAWMMGNNQKGRAFFSLTTSRSDEQGAYRSQLVEYRHEGDALYLVSRDDPELVGEKPPRRELLFQGVERFEVQFMDISHAWIADWEDGIEAYPLAIKVSLRAGNQDAERIFVVRPQRLRR
jgi:general secretion pathway protein J